MAGVLGGLVASLAGIKPKINGGQVFQDSTYIYHLIDSSQNIQILESITNLLIIAVGGGASGTYPGATSMGVGGFGGSLNTGTQTVSAGTLAVTIGAGGGYSFNSNSNPGSSTSFSGVSASGGSGTTSGAGVNGNNTQSAAVLAVKAYWGTDANSYRGVVDQGYLRGGGAGAINSTTPNLGGLGGGGKGLHNDGTGAGSPQSGLYATGGGGGGGGGISGLLSAAGPNGGSGVVILRYLK